MKKLLSLIILVSCFYSGMAQTNDEIAVNKSVQLLTQGMIDANKLVLEKITDPKLSYGHSTGRLENRMQFVENIISGKSDFVTITLTEQTIIVKEHTAIVRHTLNATTNDNGKPGDIKLYVMLIWVKERGSWKLIGRQATKIPEK